MVGNTSLMTISSYFENHSSRVSFRNEGLRRLSLATPPIGTEMLCCSTWNKTSGFRIEYFLGSGLCSLVQRKNHPETPAEGYLSFHTINTGARYSKKNGKGTKSLWAILLHGKKNHFFLFNTTSCTFRLMFSYVKNKNAPVKYSYKDVGLVSGNELRQLEDLLSAFVLRDSGRERETNRNRRKRMLLCNRKEREI